MKNEEEKTLLEATVLFPEREDAIALALKKQKIGAGFLNGAGGGLEPGEDEYRCAAREAFEEWNITVQLPALRKVAVMDFHNRKESGEIFTARVHFFFTREWQGTPRETDEMGALEWFSKASPPISRMMLADRVWFPRVLLGERIVGEAWYGPRQHTLDREPEIHDAAKEELARLRF